MCMQMYTRGHIIIVIIIGMRISTRSPRVVSSVTPVGIGIYFEIFFFFGIFFYRFSTPAEVKMTKTRCSDPMHALARRRAAPYAHNTRFEQSTYLE